MPDQRFARSSARGKSPSPAEMTDLEDPERPTGFYRWDAEERKYHEEEKERYDRVIDKLKKELAKREHVPRKKEAKEIRRKKAQGKS